MTDIKATDSFTFTTALDIWSDYGGSLPTDSNDATRLHLQNGLPFTVHWLGFTDPNEGKTIATIVGSNEDLLGHADGPLVRMHSACMFSEWGDNTVLQEWLKQGTGTPSDIHTFEAHPSPECDCKAQRVAAQAIIADEGGIYVDLAGQDGRGAGLNIKREAYRLHAQEGLDTVQAYERLGFPFDVRRYSHCARFILEDLQIERVRLLSNNPRKIAALTERGIVVTPVALVVGVTEQNIDYLQTKRDKAGHRFPEVLPLSTLEPEG